MYTIDAALRALGLEAEAGKLIQQRADIGGVYDGRRTARLGAEEREAGRLIQQRAGIGGVHDGRRTARIGAEDKGRETYTAEGRYRGCTRWTPHCAPWG